MKVRDHRSLELGCKSDVGRSSPRGLNRRSRKDAVVASDRRLFPRQNRGSGFACFDFVVVPMRVRTRRLKYGRDWQSRLESRHRRGIVPMRRP
jgi:hypothetical protein